MVRKGKHFRGKMVYDAVIGLQSRGLESCRQLQDVLAQALVMQDILSLDSNLRTCNVIFVVKFIS